MISNIDDNMYLGKMSDSVPTNASISENPQGIFNYNDRTLETGAKSEQFCYCGSMRVRLDIADSGE